jgi:lactate permease
LSGFLAIIWIIIGAIFLYNMTLISGKFEIVKESIIHISFDRRFQVLLIAFSFGAIIEGTSGFGTPVAIAGAVMVGLGFAPLRIGRSKPPGQHRPGRLFVLLLLLSLPLLSDSNDA